MLRAKLVQAANQFYSFFGAVVLLGPKSPSPVCAQPVVCRSYVKLVKVAVSYWRVVRGERAVLDTDWTPRMGAFGLVSSVAASAGA